MGVSFLIAAQHGGQGLEKRPRQGFAPFKMRLKTSLVMINAGMPPKSEG
jgi:hypothetical protein